MSMPRPRKTLEDFALKGMHYAKMTGVMAASHAISDSFLLMHSGVGCKYKTAAQAAQHDLGEHPNEREAWTQVAELHLVQGCSTRIGPFARAWWDRRHSGMMVVVSAYFIELTGDDIKAAIREVEATLPDCPMIYVQTKAPNDGFFDGYATVLAETMGRMDWSVRPTQERQATILGNFFSRHEPDARADIGQLKALVKAAGLEPGPVLFSGTPFKGGLDTAPSSRFVVQLPYARPQAKKIAALVGPRTTVPLDLPMGIAGTRRFVRELAGASGADMRKIDAWLQTQSDGVQKALDVAAEQLRTRRNSMAVFAETPLAAGLVTVLHEIGVRVPLVGLRDTGGVLGGREAFLETLRRNGVPTDGIDVLVEPSLRLVRERILTGLQTGLGGVMGSTTELDVLRHLPRSMAMNVDIPLIEVGYPSDTHHAVLNLPTLGFAGAAAWAQRVVDAFRTPTLGSASAW